MYLLSHPDTNWRENIFTINATTKAYVFCCMASKSKAVIGLPSNGIEIQCKQLKNKNPEKTKQIGNKTETKNVCVAS